MIHTGAIAAGWILLVAFYWALLYAHGERERVEGSL